MTKKKKPVNAMSLDKRNSLVAMKNDYRKMILK